MMRIKVALAVVLTILLSQLAPQTAAASAKKLHFVDEPAAPYSLGHLGGKATGGISIIMLKELFGRLGMTAELDLVPWKRALKMVEHGQADGIPVLMRTAERERYMAFTDGILVSRELFYYVPSRLGSFAWRNWKDLKPYSIGLIQGYTYGPEFLRAVKEIPLKVEPASNRQINFKKLLAGRIDLFLEDEIMANHYLRKNPARMQAFRAATKEASSYAYHMGISRKSPLAKMLPRINRLIDEMKNDGTLARILKQN